MRKAALALLLAVCLVLGACGGTGEGSTYAPAQEDRLVVYTSHKEEVWRPIVREFEERTGIWVDVVSGGTNEILERLAREKDSPKADVMFGGGVESLESYRDCFTPYRCREAEALLPQYRSAEDLWTPFSALPVVLIYNPKFLDPGQLQTWADLRNPELWGRIAFADPAVSGSCYTGLVTMLRALGGDQDETLRQFAMSLDGKLLDGSGSIPTAVSDGSAWVGVTLEETALKRIAAGADIVMVYPADGTSCVPDGSALVAGAPHEENAKRFLDFTVSGDVQGLLQQLSRRTVRGDLPPDDALKPLDEIAWVDYDVAWAAEHRSGLLMNWAFYFGTEEETP